MDDVAACTNVLFEVAEAMDAAAYDTLESLLEHAALVDGASGSVLAPQVLVAQRVLTGEHPTAPVAAQAIPVGVDM